MNSSLLILILSPALTMAAVICPPSRNQITADRELIHHVNQYDDDDRRLRADYARENKITEAEVEKRYAGSGDLYCGSSFSQGQITLKDNLLLVSGHALGYASHCKNPIKAASKCKLVIHIEKETLVYDVESEVAAGMKCPDHKDYDLRTENDWAVLKLKKRVDPRVKPYAVAVIDPKDTNSKVVAVAKSEDFHKAEKPDDLPRHYGNCDIKKIDEDLGEATRLQTNCDVDHGASGGGIFRPGASPTIVGIVENKSIGCPDGTGADGKGEFQKNCWTGLVTPINDRIVAALNAATGSKKSK